MKKLYLLRHSKAEQTSKKILDDHERSLTSKGEEYCHRVGAFMQQNQITVDTILCSSSARTTRTAEIIAPYLNYHNPIALESRLYLASVYDIFQIIHALNEDVQSLLIVGHNPGLHQFCMELAGKGSKQTYRKLRSNFPPASLVEFDAECDYWFNLSVQDGILRSFHTPKDLLTKQPTLPD